MKYKIVFHILCALVCRFPDTSAQGFELAGFKFATYPNSEVQDVSQDVKSSFLEINAFVNVPYQLKNKKTTLINGIDYVWVKSTAHDIPTPQGGEAEEIFHGISYNFNAKHDISDKWGLLVMLQPTLAGDFESNINKNYFVFLGAVIGQYRINEFWNMGAGTTYTMRFGKPTVLPLLSMDFVKGKQSLVVLLPAYTTYEYRLGNKDNFRIGAQFITNGGQFYMANTEAQNGSDIEKLTYSRANIGAYVKYRIKGMLQLSAGVGVSNRRHYRFFDVTGESYTFDLREAPFMHFGIALVPRKIS